ncbi:MAG: InlB B-repeat-containing protein [Ruminococcus sp.]|nr:InlB B-repeat-containing protein [Ruminococcus sp.]
MKLKKLSAAIIALNVLVIPFSAFNTAASDDITVLFDAGNGMVEVTEKKVTAGEAYGELPTPVLEGRTFEGWALGTGGRVAMNVVDYYGRYIVRLTPAEGDEGWDISTPTVFKEGYTVYFDMTLNDANPIGVDINDNDIDSSKFTIDGNRVYGEIKIDNSCYHSTFCFLDINSDKLCEDYTLNSFFVSPTDQYMVTPKSEVKMTEEHVLHAVWKTEPKSKSEDILGRWKYAASVNGKTVMYIEFKEDGTIIAQTFANGELKVEESVKWSEKDGAIYFEGSDVGIYYSIEGDKLTLYDYDEHKVVLDRVLPQPLGDVNNDAKIDSKDATAILVEYSARATGGAPTLIEEALDAADANKDTKVDSKDASAILSYYSYTATGGKDSLEDFLFPKEK